MSSISYRELEPRIAFDGALAATTADAVTDQSADTGSASAEPASTGGSQVPTTDTATLVAAITDTVAPTDTSKQIAFIDGAVDDLDTLIGSIDSELEIILLDETRDGVEQIAEVLASRSDIEAVHIISHGDPGNLRLGTASLTLETINGQYADELSTIGAALSNDADLLIYGCNFSDGEAGQLATAALAEQTGADVAASDDRTGHTDLGGDWTLETAIGAIEASVIVDVEGQSNWQGILATVVVDTTVDNNDSGIVDGNVSHDITWLNSNLGADGKISLREAIAAANNTADTDTISFNITDPLIGGVHSINLQSELDPITDTIIIDGWSEPDYAIGAPVIELDGTGAGTIDGLKLHAGSGGSTIRGLIINRMGEDGIDINSGSDDNLIIGNWIGLDASGTLDFGNTADGIEIGSADNIIGGTTLAERNVISGNDQRGIRIATVTAIDNLVQGNFIGTDKDGTAPVGNANDGVGILLGASNNTIQRNVIADSGDHGIQIDASADNRIIGNYIGTGVTGTETGMGNVNSGVRLENAATSNTIGGFTAADRNIISANSDGVTLADAGTLNNMVIGNYIGVDATGLTALANTDDGIEILDATDNIIGGTSAAARNVISGNAEDGVQLGGVATNNLVQGNYIGVGSDGVTAIGNLSDGVNITSAGTASDNMIGGTESGAGNVIAYNGAYGVQVTPVTSTGNSILGNSIHSNTTSGISLTGVAGNDLGDTDSGPNNAQNFPVLTSAFTDVTGGIVVSGTINSQAYGTYRVEFFANTGGGDQGQIYLGYRTVIVDSDGNASFVQRLSGAVPVTATITATATNLNTGDTSEFSATQAVAEAMVVDTVNDVLDGDTSSVASLIASRGADGFISLREAIIASNNTAGHEGIFLGDGVYDLSRAGTGENLADTGDLDITGALTLSGTGSGTVTIDGNAIDRVFEIRSGGSAYFTDMTITGGTATASNGGGIYINSGGSMVITDAVISSNTATTTGDGGGISNSGTLHADSIRVTGNSAQTGGGILNFSTVAVITNSLIDNNTATLGGGGVQSINAGADITMINVTISGNLSLDRGGGFYNGKDAELIHVTITDNTANDGGGIYEGTGGPTTYIASSIVAGNFDSAGSTDVSGSFSSGGYNIIGDVTGGSGWIASDQQNTDPLLGTLSDNGGATLTHALLAGSPAENTADPASTIATDQRGATRTGTFDVGAVEVLPTPVVDLDADDSSGATINDFAAAFAEAGGPVAIADSDAVITDSDSTTLASLTVTITNAFDGTDEILAANTTGTSIAANYDAATNTLTLSGTDTLANYQQVLRTITYDNTSSVSSETARVVTFVANDGSGNSEPATATIAVSAINNSAPINTVPGTQATPQDTSLTFSSSNGNALTTTDADALYADIEVTLSVSNGTLAVNTMSEITSAVAVNSNTLGDQQQPSIDYAADGSSVIAFRVLDAASDESVYVRRIDADGNPIGADIEVRAPSSDYAGDVEVAVADSGAFVVTWASIDQAGLTGIFARRYDAAGVALGAEFIVNTTTSDSQSSPDIAMRPDGEFIIVWHGNGFDDDAGIFYQRYDASGVAIGGETRASVSTTNSHVNASVDFDASGNFVISWSKLATVWTVGARQFTSAGVGGAELSVGSSSSSEIAVMDDGSFVVVWNDGIPDHDVYGRRYDASGTALGSAFRISDELASDYGSPQITSDSDGNFAVSYAGPSGEVLVRRYLADGTVMGDEVIVSTGSTSDITYDPQGDLSIVFTDTDADGNGIYLKRYDAPALTFSAGAPSGLSSMTFTGSLSDINVALDGLIYTPDLGYTGTDTLTITTDDLGNTGSGAALQDIDAVTINVTAAGNVAPIVDLNDDGTTSDRTWSDTFNRGDSPIAVTDVDASIIDPDDTAFATLDLVLGAVSDGASEVVTIGGTTFTYGTGQTPTVIVGATTFLIDYDGAEAFAVTRSGGGDMPLADLEALIRSITYENQSASPTVGIRTFSLMVNDGDGNSNTAVSSINVTAVNHVPVITSDGGGATASVNVAENTTTVTAVTATDSNGDTLTYSISGGADASFFGIDPVGGGLRFNIAPDFENPADSNSDNLYEVTVAVTDGNGGSDTQTISVTVTAQNDAPTFDAGDGVVSTPIYSADDYGQSVYVQPDGKILATGYAWNGSDYEISLTRYNTDGTLDTSFGGGDGIVATQVSVSTDAGNEVIVQPDGKILVAGYSWGGSYTNHTVVRYNADGTLDLTFGGGDGVANVDIGGSSYANDIALQADGKIVTAGAYHNGTDYDFAVFRLNTDGSLDTSFDTNGYLTTSFGADSDIGRSVQIQPDGMIVIGGETDGGATKDFVVARYDTNGNLDTSFGAGSGYVVTDIAGTADKIEEIKLQSDGKIVAAGYGMVGGTNEFAVVRYNADGTLDTTFDTDGIATDHGRYIPCLCPQSRDNTGWQDHSRRSGRNIGHQRLRRCPLQCRWQPRYDLRHRWHRPYGLRLF